MADRWDDSVAPGGYVCDQCGMPTESEPCALHDRTLADDVTFLAIESGLRPEPWQFDFIQRAFPTTPPLREPAPEPEASHGEG